MLRRLCILVLIACLLLPSQATALSIQEERDLGEKLLSLVRRQFDILDEPDLTQYVTGLGNEILAQAGPRYFTYHFFVIADRKFNAFAAPSGLVFLHSGLIEATRSEDELFSVLAHEVGHVIKRHIAHRIEQDKKISLGTAALLIAGAAMGGGPLGEALITGSLAAGQSMTLHFSRKDEEEADRLAFSWMRADHRDPRAMLTMLRTMQRLTKYRSGPVPPYLLTHPEPQRRAGYIQDLLVLHRTNVPRPADDFAYQRFKARVFALTNDISRRRQHYHRLAESDPVWSAYGLALVAVAEARYDEATTLLETVRRQYPDQPILIVDLARVAYESRNLEKARQLLAEARRQAPDNLYATWLLARVLETAGEQAAAAGLYEQLIAALPDYADPYQRLARLKSAAGRPGESLYYLGCSYWLSGDGDRARDTLERAVAKLAAGPIKSKAETLLATIERVEKKF